MLTSLPVHGVAAPSSRLVPAIVSGPAGALEAILRVPPVPVGAAVVAHPHPLHGGTMHTKVVHRASRLLADRLALTTLRFNFRGVGASQGTHDEGRGEVDDLLSAASHARGLVTAGPFVMGGFSFGSICALRAAPRVRPDVLLLIGLPILRWDVEAIPDPGVPVVWIQGARDEYGGGEAARSFADARGWEVAVVEGADHFFAGRLDAFEEEAVPRLARRLPP